MPRSTAARSTTHSTAPRPPGDRRVAGVAHLSERDAAGELRRITCPGCSRDVSLKGSGARTVREGRTVLSWSVSSHGAGGPCPVRGVLIDPELRTISAAGTRALV